MTEQRNLERRRVVVTGMGAISPLGNDVETSWQGLIAGRSGVRPITAFDTTGFSARIAATVKGFDPTQSMDPKEARRLSPFIQYAVAAAVQSVLQASIDFTRVDQTRCGVEIGSSLGGAGIIEEQRLVMEARGPRMINPTLIPAIIINSAACSVALRYGLHGPVNAPVGACATGVIALGEAYRKICSGDADVMIAGGTDSVMTPLAVAAFGRLGALSSKNDTPERACAPFSGDRDGTVVGEGAAVLVLESLEHAQRRGAKILAEVAGYGQTSDAYHLVAPEPGGAHAAAAMRAALSANSSTGDALSWVCAHGTGTPLNDLAETRAIKKALGEMAYRVPVSSLKGGLGHMLGASGAISVAAAVKAIQTGTIPPTINYTSADPECDLDYVPNAARSADVSCVLVNAFGFGGQNACLAVKRWAH